MGSDPRYRALRKPPSERGRCSHTSRPLSEAHGLGTARVNASQSSPRRALWPPGTHGPRMRPLRPPNTRQNRAYAIHVRPERGKRRATSHPRSSVRSSSCPRTPRQARAVGETTPAHTLQSAAYPSPHSIRTPAAPGRRTPCRQHAQTALLMTLAQLRIRAMLRAMARACVTSASRPSAFTHCPFRRIPPCP
jgi:hypothetical protein